MKGGQVMTGLAVVAVLVLSYGSWLVWERRATRERVARLRKEVEEARSAVAAQEAAVRALRMQIGVSTAGVEQVQGTGRR
ncbi:MAG: hypothetical protein N2595_05345 [bacterium]|nr:hypothetical protein [bacterium]